MIPPSSVLQHMRDAATWLTTRRRWRATTLVWSIHKTNESHDRAGEGKRGTFHVLSMNDLISLVSLVSLVSFVLENWPHLRNISTLSLQHQTEWRSALCALKDPPMGIAPVRRHNSPAATTTLS